MEYCVCSMGCDFLLNLSCCNAKQRTVQTRAKRVCHVNSVAKPGKTLRTVTCFLGDLRALVALTCKTHTFDWSWGDTPVLCTSPWKLEKTCQVEAVQMPGFACCHPVDRLLDSFPRSWTRRREKPRGDRSIACSFSVNERTQLNAMPSSMPNLYPFE